MVYKFKDTTSENDRQKALDGIKDLARKIPGVKNIWLKTNRNQIRDLSGVYPSSSPARKPPPITRKALRTKPGPNNGKLSAKTACPSKSPTHKNTRPDRAGNRVTSGLWVAYPLPFLQRVGGANCIRFLPNCVARNFSSKNNLIPHSTGREQSHISAEL